MKFLRQFGIILLLSALGEGLHALLPLPVPASVYGLVLMLAALMTGIIKVGQVEETADFLIEIMPVMFVPAGVGLLNAWGGVAANLGAGCYDHSDYYSDRDGSNRKSNTDCN